MQQEGFITPKIIKHFIETQEFFEDYVKQMVLHEKCPPEIRTKKYEETGDETFLPQEVQDIFVF